MKMKVKNNNINRGAAFISIIFALLFFTLMARFVYIQGTGKVDGVVLAALAEKKYTKQRTIEAHRGTVYDRNGNPIAEDTSSYTVVAILDEDLTVDKDDPQHVVDPEETARKLSPLLNMDENEMYKILTKPERKQVEFGTYGRDISTSLKQEIESLELPGIAFRRESKRYYPNGTFASHVVGYAQMVTDPKTKETETVGKMGIEQSLDKYLQEKDGYMKFQSDTKGFKLPDAKEQIVAPDNGSDVYLTIDQTIQTFLEDAMNTTMKEYEPEKIIGVVANPKTGEILAMSSRPSFDPNVRNIQNYLNDAISYPFEPGSTMKIFTLAAAIEEGVYNGNATFASGSYTAGGETIRDHNRRGWGTITYDEGVLKSSNVAFAKLANEQLGTDKLLEYLGRFGLDRPTGIDLAGEVQNTINFKWEIDRVSTAFGQASSVTPIQQIQAATAIANGGKMMKPYVVEKIVDPDTDKTVVDHKPQVVGQPVSAETTKKVLNLLRQVVTDGTGKAYDLEGYQVAGKTGTAQIPSPQGGYLSGRGNFLYSFLGMAPMDDPKLIVYVAVEKPKLKDTDIGHEPVVMVFNHVMKNSLQYLNIQPIEQNTENNVNVDKEVEVDSYVGKSIEEAKASIDKLQLKATVIGKGKNIIAQSPSQSEKILPNEQVFLLTDQEATLPDMTNWSIRDVMRVADLTNIKVSHSGSGYVVQQSLEPGAIIKDGDSLSVKLERPYTPQEETAEQPAEESENSKKEQEGN
ncbi:penicillin-binding protein [Fredinandcohnia sp. QZ13]|uniref:penicillin-binding protein n=1 Tax=Fredinandcohnia sp. QZ13 TaxID=3073144 RepID=UPI0028533B1B|nr:penicillin-binding protein [Fredinandcohnia sp. QZ13]MDR4886596.1 penicillin-binding protein [Fredinandcohnia sp. QZ13]